MKKSPISALFWSMAFPGLGQLYNKEYIKGLVLMGLEIYFNVMSNINMSLIYTINLEIHKALTVANIEWGLFYPSIYAFSMWDAFNRAKDINHIHDIENGNSTMSKERTYYTGLFLGLVIGMVLGLSINFLISPVLSGVLTGFIGAICGNFVEGLYVKHKNTN
ncbi:hypothetical protein J416_04126 [Gracilibacillus halophilus YIM-C55.5]|uniref:DUF5683 domain-containing protein n=1 Tax=Gracilibacillus halophilus YIM-C55.5 TaxID=1308866 RepID=N4WBP9_9BACI|nr:DUF5683 domain-containing protein [Gracilibacillus halophilus]ENH97723.1 hypothetical protein J416_04126 [Gracilibacillus halophilus YIM-C55.5]